MSEKLPSGPEDWEMPTSPPLERAEIPRKSKKEKRQPLAKRLWSRFVEGSPKPEAKIMELADVFTDFDVLHGTVTIPIPEGVNAPEGAKAIQVHTEKTRGTEAFHADSEKPKEIGLPSAKPIYFAAGHGEINMGSNFDSVTTIRFQRTPEPLVENAGEEQGLMPNGFTVTKKVLRDPVIQCNLEDKNPYDNGRALRPGDSELLNSLELIAREFQRRGEFKQQP